MSEKIFVIGDIHGCLDMFTELLNRIPWRSDKDVLILLGDYIDRGGQSRSVVDFILRLTEGRPHVHCLMGNHEDMLLDYLSGRNQSLYLVNNGMSTLRQYAKDKRTGERVVVPEDHLAFYRSLKPYVEFDDYYFVHAGFRPGVDITNQAHEDLVWIREPFIYSGYDFGKKVIFGHTPFQKPLVMNNKIGLDTGAVYGNRLTCLELPEERFHSVGA